MMEQSFKCELSGSSGCYITIMQPIFLSRKVAARPGPTQCSEEKMAIRHIWQDKAHLLEALDG